MDDNADAKRILLASPPADWRRQLGHPCITWLITVQQDLRHHHLTLPKQQIWLRNEDDIDVWRHAILQFHARNQQMLLSDDSSLHAKSVSSQSEGWQTFGAGFLSAQSGQG